MTTVSQVRDAVNKLLVDAYPDTTVYINRCPVKFVRPSFWLETVKADSNSVNFSTVQKDIYFSITCFIKMDDYGESDDAALTDIQESVVNIFNQGYVRVGDRAIKVKASTAGHDNDRSYVDLQFEYFDDRSDTEDNTPLMGDMDITIQKGE